MPTQRFRVRRSWLLPAVCILFAGCVDRRAASTVPVVFAGPVDLPLHEDIKPKSRVVVRVRHGDKLEIVQQRRRLYKLRTAKGIEGWTDERNLMSVAQMDALARLEERARRLPSQGAGTTYEILNVHTEPQRYSPSFLQIREGEKFDVIAHQTAPRVGPARRVLVKPQPKVPRERKGAKGVSKRFPPPPVPVAPKPPDDWLKLSRERLPPEPADTDKDDDPKPQPTDDWTLVRTPRGDAGWVLTGRIYLAIPDEVAQYAEGHRITTYFSLGKIRDSELEVDKDIWLWTTVRAGPHPYDYDSFRVFTWNPKRHRYETAYIQRSVEGYLPVLVEKTGGQTMFSVCVTNDDNLKERKRYVLVDRQVKGADVQACAAADQTAAAKEAPPSLAVPETSPSLTQKLKDKAGEVKKKVLGR